MLGLLLLSELIILYFLSRWVTQAIFTFFILLFRARSVAVSFLLLLEFPGTVMHELAHLFTAEILGVRTGKMRLEPESIREDTIQAGSVMIAQTDPFRRYAIGLAPLFAGILSLTAISYFIPDILSNVINSGLPILSNTNTYILLGLGYLLFAISNTMFSSPEDLKGFPPFAIVLVLIAGAAYLLGMRIVLTGQVLEVATRIITTLIKSLGVVLGINIALLILLSGATYVLTRMLRVKIV